jgi:hypothetical protein
VPQELLVSDAHFSHVPVLPPLQQPSAQEVASHWHCPVVVLHSWPVGHAAHAAPAEPHDALDSLDSASQLPLEQQPEHEPPPHSHSPLEHACPDWHALHVAPPVPHSELDCDPYATHVVPLQQPLGHEAASHTHVPLALHA